MEGINLSKWIGVLLFLLASLYLLWRHFWFYRNPPRKVPEGDNVVSPADGTVVYVNHLPPKEPVLSIKKRKKISICDIVRTDLEFETIHIGIFMSPFNVHYNRAPISGTIESIRHSPAEWKNRFMGAMHWRTLLRRFPLYEGSFHLVENERTVTRIGGEFNGLRCPLYVVQIAGGSVCGIDSYLPEQGTVNKGEIFGMIRIGSQVDVVFPYMEKSKIMVKPGQKVRAGETILVCTEKPGFQNNGGNTDGNAF
jgi:phosphatidylserine decarboxylase